MSEEEVLPQPVTVASAPVSGPMSAATVMTPSMGSWVGVIGRKVAGALSSSRAMSLSSRANIS